MKDLIGRTATAIGVGASAEDIHASLKDEGLSDYDCYLTYIAAKMVAQAREAPVPPRTK